MSTRYNDRDYDRERQNYRRRSTPNYGREHDEPRQRYYRYDDSDLENERYGRENEYDRYSPLDDFKAANDMEAKLLGQVAITIQATIAAAIRM